jgi:hypothetical protein
MLVKNMAIHAPDKSGGLLAYFFKLDHEFCCKIDKKIERG